MARNWANFDLAKEAGEVLLEMQDDVVELNKEQLRVGERSDRQPIRPKYKKKYEQHKRRKYNYNLDGTPNLLKEGDFYKQFRVQLAGDNKYKIDSWDWKNRILTTTYSPLIFGLNNENKYFIQPKMQSALVRRIENTVLK